MSKDYLCEQIVNMIEKMDRPTLAILWIVVKGICAATIGGKAHEQFN